MFVGRRVVLNREVRYNVNKIKLLKNKGTLICLSQGKKKKQGVLIFMNDILT